jgi:acylphosphatase
MRRLEAKIYGFVQGVGFRYFSRRNALILGLVGYVKNLSDGSVEVVAEGEIEKIKEFLEILKKGNSYALVEKVEYELKDPENKFNDFYIL